MKINFSRFKVFMLGIIGIILTFAIFIMYTHTTVAFTPFENIAICFFLLQTMFISLFFIWWGIEPYSPDLELFGKKKEGDLKE